MKSHPRLLRLRQFATRRAIVLFRLGLLLVILVVTWHLLYVGGYTLDWSKSFAKKSSSASGDATASPHRNDEASASANHFNPTILESARVWEWEISSGHYPSQDLPAAITAVLPNSVPNPGLPNETTRVASHRSHPPITGSGFHRQYIDPRTIGSFSQTPNSSSSSFFPKRPPPGSIADFDKIMQSCDYENERNSRDCLEFLRLGAGLDNANLFRNPDDIHQSSYIYLEEEIKPRDQRYLSQTIQSTTTTTTPSRLTIPQPLPYHTYSDLINPTHSNTSTLVSSPASPCDPDHPRIFHLFWSSPFTSHPYMAILSFLYTQNLGLDKHSSSFPSQQLICRPKLWVWIWDPHLVSSDPNTEHEIHRILASNMWSRPFLHSRFRDIIEFKFWDMSHHLDAMGDLLENWRDALGFSSDEGHGNTLQVTNEGRVYDKSNSRFLTIVSDLARFVITYLYGGIYIDADTIFLRDWEELWGYRGAFAYRWSHIQNEYNTAVLKMNKGSMLGNVLIRAARRGAVSKKWWEWWKKDAPGMEFHPKEGISKYVEEMNLVLPVEPNGRKGLLWMLPVALFDPAWLATDGYETGRMAIPGFESFDDFFETPIPLRHQAELLGLDGFFRGAYSYHWHNQWKTPFDKERQYPDWGTKLLNHTNELSNLYPSLNLNLTHTPNTPFDSTSTSTSPSSTSQSKWSATLSNLTFWKWFWSPWRHRHPPIANDDHSLPWSAIVQRTMEAFIRGEAPNLYGEYFVW